MATNNAVKSQSLVASLMIDLGVGKGGGNSICAHVIEMTSESYNGALL
jgi:hypothetical protein